MQQQTKTRTQSRTTQPETILAPNRNSVSASSTSAVKPAPSTEEIAKLAYSIWCDSGKQHGSDVNHWLQAEAMLKAD